MSKELRDELLMELINIEPKDTINVVNVAVRIVLAERERCAIKVEEMAQMLRTDSKPSSPDTFDALAEQIREGK